MYLHLILGIIKHGLIKNVILLLCFLIYTLYFFKKQYIWCDSGHGHFVLACRTLIILGLCQNLVVVGLTKARLK